MNKDKRNNIKLLGTLNNADESGIIANANQIYDANEDKSTQDVSKEHTERIKTLEDKENLMQTTLENITKTGEASAASNVTYNHNDSKLDATNVQQAIDEVDSIGHFIKKGGIVNISTNYNNDYTAKVLTLGQAIAKVPSSDRVLGFTMTFLSSDGWKNYQFTGTTIDNWTDINNWISFVNDAQLRQTNNNLGSLKLREFSKSVANKKGDKIKYKGNLYEFIENADAGEFDSTKVKPITYFDIFNDKAAIADNKQAIADNKAAISQTNNNLGSLKLREFSSSAANKKGDKVKYHGGLYEFIEDAPAGEFDLTKVKTITYFDIFNDKAAIADNKQAIADNKAAIADNKQAIADNKAAISQTKEDLYYVTSKDIELYNNKQKYCGKFIVGSEVVISEDIDPTHMDHVIVPISPNDVITFENTYYTTNQVMAFLDIDNKVISIVTRNTPQFEVSAIAPKGSVKVFLNIHHGFTYKATIKSYESPLKYIADNKQEQQVPCLKFGYSDLGCINIATPIFDYNIIISYGQSLSVGDGTINEDTNSPQNCYMLGDTPFNASSYLVNAELKRLHVNSGRSSFTPSISATSHIASILNRIQNTNNKKFIALGGGNGGYSVAQLMDKARYVDVNTNEFYFPNLSTWEPYKNLFAALKRIKQIADSENKTCGVIAFVWIQGEGDAWGNGNFKTDTTTCSCAGNKDEWLKRVRQLHKDVADDLHTYLEQDVSPAWFIHNIQGGFIPKYSGVLEAQTEIIDNIDYFSINPAYQLPNLKDQHLTGNGYRWYGELIAKSILDVILHNKEPYVVRIKDAHIMGDKKSVVLYFSVPVPPLKHDTQIQPEMKNAGFYVTDLNGKELNINKIDIYADFIILRLESQIENGIYIEYATNTSKSESDADVVGAGNICDSALSLSYYTNAEEIGPSSNPVQYVPKSESGDTLVGKRYSLNNYCIPFRILCNL